jgi:tetratricopeptide (TPR) repeat protein
MARRTIKLTRAPWRTHFLLAGILYGQKYYTEALSEFSLDESENPWGADAILHRGKTLRQLNRFDSAEAECRRALALVPNYADAAVTLASLMYFQSEEARKASRRGEAAEFLRRARVWIAYSLSFFPAEPEPLKLLGYVELKDGRKERAVNAWERYLKARPTDAGMRDRLAALRSNAPPQGRGESR